MRVTRGLAPLIVVALLSSGTEAQPRDRAAAEALFDAGREALERDDYAAACKSFAESMRLDPAPGTALNLGVCHEKQGQLASAWQRFKEAVSQLDPKDDRVGYANEQIAALKGRVPRLTVELAKDAPQGARIFRDDIELRSGSLGLPLPLDPGRHTVTVKAPGRRDRAYELTMAEGEKKKLVVDAGQRSAPTTKSPTPSRPPTTSDAPDRTLAYVVGGVGLAALGVSGVTGAMTLSRKNTVDDHCFDRRCDETGLDAVSSGRTLSTVSTVAFAVGVAGTGVGLYLLLSAGGGSEAAVHASAMPGGGALRVRSSF